MSAMDTIHVMILQTLRDEEQRAFQAQLHDESPTEEGFELMLAYCRGLSFARAALGDTATLTDNATGWSESLGVIAPGNKVRMAHWNEGVYAEVISVGEHNRFQAALYNQDGSDGVVRSYPIDGYIGQGRWVQA